jgi:hypothetical protein
LRSVVRPQFVLESGTAQFGIELLQPLPRFHSLPTDSGRRTRARPDIDGAALKGKGGVAGNRKQRAETRQGRRDLLDDAVGEILLLGIGAEIF